MAHARILALTSQVVRLHPGENPMKVHWLPGVFA